MIRKQQVFLFTFFVLTLLAGNLWADQGFNFQAYLSPNPDLPQNWTKAQCIAHYTHYGFSEKRAIAFDLAEYLSANPDLPENWTYAEALSHFNLYGKNENRLLAFDAQEYLSLYGDLPGDWSYPQAYSHYLAFGREEGRVASFDEIGYLDIYADLPGSWGQTQAFQHYRNFGQKEGRVYDPYDESVFTDPVSPPSVTITTPTRQPAYATSMTQLVISGTAMDDVGVVDVRWSNSINGSGVCTGTTAWSAVIPLFTGDNIIAISATDAHGYTGEAILSVSHGTGHHTLSGTISSVTNATLDSDVNDPNESYLPNDTPETAQSVPTPITLGGYVNESFTGEQGRSFTVGDIDDFFLANLKAGDRIFLSIADYTTADLDLWLYDVDKKDYIDVSMGTENSEGLTIQRDGTYAVNVYAFSGASNYVLAIGADNTYIPDSSFSLSSDFIPGQAIVRFKDQSAVATEGMMANLASTMGMRMAAGGPGRLALVHFDKDRSADLFRALGVEEKKTIEKPVGASLQKKMDTLQAIKALRKRSDVRYAEPNYIIQRWATPNDSYYDLQWHYPLINLPDAWNTTTGSNQVVVAVVDTGILLNHPDLQGVLTSDGYDFISDTVSSVDGDGIDSNPNDPGDGNVAGSSSFHGTHCAGTVAASSNNSQGVAGVSWSTRIMPIRVLGKGGQGTGYDILQGVLYAAGLANDSGTVPDKPADIISLSLGSSYYSSAAQAVYNQVRNAGVIVVAAAGNESSSAPGYPASYGGVISVSAVDINGNLSSYSNTGNFIDVAAPGGDSGDFNGDGYSDMVLSTCGDDSSGSVRYNYAFKAGTSMATPHVAGVAALMKGQRPGLTPDEFYTFLKQFKITDDIGPAGRDDLYGYGLINAFKAVQAAAQETISTTLSCDPVVLNFGYSSTLGTLFISNIGSGAIAVTGVTDNVPWLTVTADDVDAGGLGIYAVRIDRSGLADGYYDGVVTFTSTENTVVVPVNMSVIGSGFQSNAGYHYVLLIAPDTMEAVQQQNVQASNGAYHFTFTGVPFGDRYKIYGGSDRDNDSLISDAGEAVGAYQSLDQPATVTVTGDMSDLNFVSDFNFGIPSSSETGTTINLPRLMRRGQEKSLRR